MPGVNGNRKKGRLIPVIITITITLIALSASPSGAQSLSNDRQDSLMISPMGWTAMILYPIGIGLNGALRTMFISYGVYNPFAIGGQKLEEGVNQPLLDKARQQNRDKYMHPNIFAGSENTNFLYRDLANSISYYDTK